MPATWTGEWCVVVLSLPTTGGICGEYSASAFTRRWDEEDGNRIIDEIAGTSLPEYESKQHLERRRANKKICARDVNAVSPRKVLKQCNRHDIHNDIGIKL